MEEARRVRIERFVGTARDERRGRTFTDRDGDGIVNARDTDSDGDTLSDLFESGQDAATVDADGGGQRDDMATAALRATADASRRWCRTAVSR